MSFTKITLTSWTAWTEDPIRTTFWRWWSWRVFMTTWCLWVSSSTSACLRSTGSLFERFVIVYAAVSTWTRLHKFIIRDQDCPLIPFGATDYFCPFYNPIFEHHSWRTWLVNYILGGNTLPLHPYSWIWLFWDPHMAEIGAHLIMCSWL